MFEVLCVVWWNSTPRFVLLPEREIKIFKISFPGVGSELAVCHLYSRTLVLQRHDGPQIILCKYVNKLNTQCLQNSAVSEEQSVLTLHFSLPTPVCGKQRETKKYILNSLNYM